MNVPNSTDRGPETPATWRGCDGAVPTPTVIAVEHRDIRVFLMARRFALAIP
jgi:hypothetical protein